MLMLSILTVLSLGFKEFYTPYSSLGKYWNILLTTIHTLSYRLVKKFLTTNIFQLN